MGEAARQLETTGSNAANVWLPRPEDLPQPRDAANNVIPFPEAAEQKGRLWHEMLGARAEAAKYIQDLHDGKETEFQTYQAIEERFEELAREYAALEPGFDRAAFLNEHGGDWRELARSHRPGHEAAPSQKFQNLVELSDKMADEEQKADNLQAEIKAAAEKDAQVAGEERERAKREALDLMHALKLAKWVASHGETFEQRLGWPKEQLAQVVENLENGSVEPMDYIRGMHGCVGVIKEIKQSEKVEPGRREAEAARNTESPEELEAREKYESLKREYEEKKARLKPKDTYKRDKKTGASYYVLGELDRDRLEPVAERAIRD